MPQKESMVIQTLWKDGVSKICHGDKEVEKATAEGFGPYNPSEHQYPRWMYNGASATQVNSLMEEADYKSRGWSGKPTEDYGKTLQVEAPKAVAAAVPVADERVSGLAARLALAEANVANLESKVAELSALVAALTEPAPAAPAPEPAKEETKSKKG